MLKHSYIPLQQYSGLRYSISRPCRGHLFVWSLVVRMLNQYGMYDDSTKTTNLLTRILSGHQSSFMSLHTFFGCTTFHIQHIHMTTMPESKSSQVVLVPKSLFVDIVLFSIFTACGPCYIMVLLSLTQLTRIGQRKKAQRIKIK